MANETVVITVLSDDPSPVPISSMVIEFFTTLGVFVTQGTTDTNGQVTVLLPDGTYNVLFYKQGVSILPKQPQQIVVSPPTPPATSVSYLVSGHVTAMPESTDPLRCRISGQLLDASGLPATDLRISFRPKPDFQIVGGNLVSVQNQIEVHPDDTGYFQFDLLRGVPYTAALLTVDNLPQLNLGPPLLLDVIAPNLAAMSLPNLLFPLPVSVIFSPDTISIPLAGGQDGSSTLATITYSDGSTSGTGPSNRTQLPPFATLDYVYSDPTLFTTVVANGVTTILPLATGTGTVYLTRTVSKWAFWPSPPSFSSPPLTVTIV